MVRRLLKAGLRKLVLWAAKEKLEELHKEVAVAAHDAGVAMASRVKGAITAEADKLRQQMSALQALDVNFRESGKIILIARVNDKDIVKIIDIAPRMTLENYRHLSRELEDQYGISKRVVDGPPGLPKNFFAG